MIKLNDRQNKVLGFIRKNKSAKNKDLLNFISRIDEKITRLTVVRDLNKLIKDKLILKRGRGRN
ncbi:MAG: hypothetical protein NTU76_01040, partial [Candidatus Taylorbacteria bacterium]|nr:hypothetical protein [Candidatus Taylorbacteria bacterium]